MFGSLLKNSAYASNYTWDDVKNMALSGLDANNILEQEFITLVSKAKKVYAVASDKKKKNKLL